MSLLHQAHSHKAVKNYQLLQALLGKLLLLAFSSQIHHPQLLTPLVLLAALPRPKLARACQALRSLAKAKASWSGPVALGSVALIRGRRALP